MVVIILMDSLMVLAFRSLMMLVVSIVALVVQDQLFQDLLGSRPVIGEAELAGLVVFHRKYLVVVVGEMAEMVAVVVDHD